MTREEAFRVIQDNRPKSGYVVLNEALDMALDAPWEQECRDTLPLRLEDLRKMDGQTVYCLDLNTDVTVRAPKVGLIYVSSDYYVLKANEVTLYQTKPGEVQECVFFEW